MLSGYHEDSNEIQLGFRFENRCLREFHWENLHHLFFGWTCFLSFLSNPTAFNDLRVPWTKSFTSYQSRYLLEALMSWIFFKVILLELHSGICTQAFERKLFWKSEQRLLRPHCQFVSTLRSYFKVSPFRNSIIIQRGCLFVPSD